MTGPDQAAGVVAYADVAAEIMRRPPVNGARVVGVDGPSGSGKSTLARRLLAHLPGAALVEIDDFTSWADPQGWWPRFATEVMAPLTRRADARYRVRDWSGDEFGTGLGGWKTTRWAPVIVVEGVTCARRAAAGWLSYTIWVQAPAELNLARGLERDGADHREHWLRWMAWERRFFAADGTRERADLRVDGAPTLRHDPRRELVVLAHPPTARVRVAEPLRFLLPARHRHGDIEVPVDGTSTLGHVVESLGVPRTEVGELRVDDRPVPPADRPRPGDVVDVAPVARPQPIAAPRFLLDVHLGTLARRMRLLGLDTAYRNTATDAELVTWANAERRVLLTRDRGLLRRRALTAGAYVRGDRADDQLADVLDRYAPPLAPWTRCPACNGELVAVPKRGGAGAAGAGHPPLVHGLLPLPGLRPAVLAGRARGPAGRRRGPGRLQTIVRVYEAAVRWSHGRPRVPAVHARPRRRRPRPRPAERATTQARAEPRRLGGPSARLGERLRRGAGRAAVRGRLAGRAPPDVRRRRRRAPPAALVRPGEPLPHPTLVAARDRLSEHYAAELGEPFVTAGMCLYRDGRDSVAWHGDTIGRGAHADTMVAIVSFGSPRALLLRPRGGGESRRFPLGHGDLIVMGGSCQRTWEHAVPKTARPVGPRVSVQFRPAGVA